MHYDIVKSHQHWPLTQRSARGFHLHLPSVSAMKPLERLLVEDVTRKALYRERAFLAGPLDILKEGQTNGRIDCDTRCRC
jgi:hypothetical protein